MTHRQEVSVWSNAGLTQSILFFLQDGSTSTTTKTQMSTCQVGVARSALTLLSSHWVFPALTSLSPPLRFASWHQHWRVRPADVQVRHRDEGPCDWGVQGQTLQGQRGKPEGRRSVLLPQGKSVLLLLASVSSSAWESVCFEFWKWFCK